MESLVRPDRLRERILIWTEEEIRGDRLPLQSSTVLEAVLYRGSLPRGEVAPLLNVGDRHARRITSALLDRGILTSTGPRAPLFLAFPAALASRWMPGLFPDKGQVRSEEHTSELQSLMRISYAVFCLKKKNTS